MKNTFTIVFIYTITILCISLKVYAQTATTPNGQGTQENPYEIYTLENLYWLSQNSQHWDKYYKQTANINAYETQYWNGGEGWEPIGNSDTKFTGSYDGGGNVIENLYVNRPELVSDNSYQALFGWIENAMITSLGIIDADITGYYYVGALVGRNDNSTINNCFGSGEIHGEWNIGMLSGTSSNGSIIEECYSAGEIYGVRYVGGLVGYNNATLNNSYSNAGLFDGPRKSGGLVGINHENGIINDSYSTGFVDNTASDYGGLVGDTVEGGETNRSYWNTETSEQDVSAGGEGKTTAEMIDSVTFTDWDFDSTWSIVAGESYPYLQWQDGPNSQNYPYKSELIINADPEEGGTSNGAGFYEEGELIEISANPNEGYFFVTWTGNTVYADDPDAETTTVTMPDSEITLTANYSPITLTVLIEPDGTGSVTMNPDNAIYHEGDTVTLSANPSLDQGYIFDNWTIGETVLSDEDETKYTMPDTAVTITANFKEAFAGGSGTEQDPWLIATAEQLDNIRNYLGETHGDKYFKQTANIDLNVSPYNTGGGWEPIGYDWDNCFSGTYEGGDEYEISGLYINRSDSDNQGLFGYLREAEINNTAIVNVNVTGQDHTGALAGTKFSSVIENCSSSGVITGNNRVGGLVGYFNENSIKNSHSSCSVLGMGDNVGGLAGGSFSNSVIDNCYSTGNVEGNKNTGGLIGEAFDNTIVLYSYSNGEVIGNSNCAGGLVGRNYGTIEYSYSASNVNCSGNYGGGLVGYNDIGSLIKNSYSKGNLTVTGTGTMWFGGLAGIITDSEIQSSYSTGIVTGNERTGGLTGQIQNSTISNCYSTGLVEGTDDTGGLLGYYNGGTVENSYWNTETSNQQTSVEGEGKTTLEMMTMETFNNWDFENIWQIEEDTTYPYLQWQAEAGEHNTPELYTLTINVNPEGAGTIEGDGLKPAGGYIPLSATAGEGAVFVNWTDIEENELSSDELYIFEMPDCDTTIHANFDIQFAGGFGTEEEPWLISTPEHLNNVRLYLGYDNKDRFFKQIEDINLNVSPWNENNGWEPIGSGMTGFTATYLGDGNVIEGLFMNRPDEYDIGLFKYTDHGANITDVHLEDVDITGYNRVGALIGQNRNSKIIYCSSTGKVQGNSQVGGLAGENSSATIKNSYSKAECQASNQVGGLVGVNSSDTIESSYSDGIVSSNYDKAGGLVGVNDDATIINSYSTTGVSGRNELGGLVGEYIYTEYGLIENSYSTGRVLGESNIGGLIGSGPDTNIENCYWDTIVSGINVSAAGEGINTEDMVSQNSFTNWDFVDTWEIIEDITFPYLQWQGSDIEHNAPPEFFELTLIASPEEGGTVEGEGEYPEGGVVELTANPNEGYLFENWTDPDENILSNEEEFLYTMANEPITLKGNFALADYEINVSIYPENTGNVIIQPEQDYYHYNQEITVIAVPEEGYSFDGWDESESDTLRFEMPASDTTLHASFNLAYYELNVDKNPPEAGTVTVTPDQSSYNMGDIITLSVNTYQGYEFENWTDEEDNIIGEQETIEYTMPAENITLTANFNMIDYTCNVNISPENAGTVSFEPQLDYYNYEDEITLTAIPEDGYKFMHWTDESENVLSSSEHYSFQMPANNIELTANFESTVSFVKYPDAEITISPVPARDKLKVISDELMKKLRLINVNGKVLMEKNIEDSQHVLNTSGLESGVYYLQIYMTNEIKTYNIQIVK